jgi:hypothetical protein
MDTIAIGDCGMTTMKPEQNKDMEAAEKFAYEVFTYNAVNANGIAARGRYDGFLAGIQHAQSQPFYLHSDDNYYWTPEAWAEYQALKAAKLSERELKLVEALREIQKMGFEKNCSCCDGGEHRYEELCEALSIYDEDNK